MDRCHGCPANQPATNTPLQSEMNRGQAGGPPGACQEYGV